MVFTFQSINNPSLGLGQRKKKVKSMVYALKGPASSWEEKQVEAKLWELWTVYPVGIREWGVSVGWNDWGGLLGTGFELGLERWMGCRLMQEGWETCIKARYKGRDEVCMFRAHQGCRMRASKGEEQETWPVSRMRAGGRILKTDGERWGVWIGRGWPACYSWCRLLGSSVAKVLVRYTRGTRNKENN